MVTPGDYPTPQRNGRFPSVSSLRNELQAIRATRDRLLADLLAEEDRVVLRLAAQRNDEQLAGDLDLKTGPGACKRRMQAEGRGEPELVAAVTEKIAQRRRRARRKGGRRLADERDGVTPSERPALDAQRRARRPRRPRSRTVRPPAIDSTDEIPASPVVERQLTPDWRPAKPKTLGEIERMRVSRSSAD
jgi:hypothetical protein